MKKAFEIQVGDKIKVYRGYCDVLEIKEEDKSLLFKYVNIDGILNWIRYRKTTSVKIY